MKNAEAIKIFFSYCHEDEELVEHLQKHLNPLRQAKVISEWYDRAILPGADWDEEIMANLKGSDIILFLVSPDFLSSEYILENEIKHALELHNSGSALVVPVMLRKCDIEYTEFKNIQGLPTDMEPISSAKWFSIDDACFNVVEGLKKIIKKESRKREAATVGGNDVPETDMGAAFKTPVPGTKPGTLSNVVSWFEIPTNDINRAQQFYETIFDITMAPLETPLISMRLFPLKNLMGIGGALVYNKQYYKPSATDGPLLYLNGNPDVQHILNRVEAAGGKILIPKTQISPEYGYMAAFMDTEGNRVALHSTP